ncbi:MAG: transcription antitermination factor NusB [Nitriliruptoraceae bacterium]
MSGSSPAAGLPARRAALVALQQVEERGSWSNLAVPAAIEDLTDVRDRAFAAHLAYETLRWEGTLDAALQRVLSRDLSDVEAALRRILRLGATQLTISDVPARAAVDTSVALAREAVPAGRAKGAAGFVNGVLRALARRGDDLGWPTAEDDPIRHLALSTGHPDWIVSELLARYPFARVRAILTADDVAPGVTLRAVGDRDEVLAELEAQGLEVAPGSTPGSIRAPGTDPRAVAAVAAGRAVVQDEASLQVVHATGTTSGDRVLDLCAGPGGKTTHLAQLAGEQGSVTAVELHEHRARLIREAAARQGLAVEVLVADARRPPLPDGASYDVVLLDAPCTGLGTGRRRPEVRWRRTPEEVGELAALQAELLRAAATWVAPGGRLTYAVCTWTAEETGGVVDAFDAEEAAATFTRTMTRQLLPDTDDTDGMFIATWERSDDQGNR